ncbi:MAG TPA: hypothetical protein VFF84_08340 [Sphingobium sp.]|nr:hypothetical protein [Sphingobium sp.]
MFRLEFFISSDAAPIVRIIDLEDEGEAVRTAKALIAEECGVPGAFVQFDPAGRFSVGAGFRVWSGGYSLRQVGESGRA